MSGDSTGGTFADEAMRATGIRVSATAAGVWNANVILQSRTNRDTNGRVIETEAHEAMRSKANRHYAVTAADQLHPHLHQCYHHLRNPDHYHSSIDVINHKYK